MTPYILTTLLLVAQAITPGIGPTITGNVNMANEYWFLARTYDSSGLNVRAFGPYPSLEFCKAAGNTTIPDEEAFMTDAQLASMKAERDKQQKDVEERHKVAVAKIKKRIPNKKYDLEDGSTVMFDEKGNEVQAVFDSTLISGFSVGRTILGTSYHMVRGCTKIEVK